MLRRYLLVVIAVLLGAWHLAAEPAQARPLQPEPAPAQPEPGAAQADAGASPPMLVQVASETQTAGDSQSNTSGPMAEEGHPPPPIAEDHAGAPLQPRQDGTAEAAAAAVVLAASQDADVERALPPVDLEAQGTCKTPRQAWLQLLYWLQQGEDRWEPAKAAACFDTSRLQDPAQAGERAAMLKEILDGRNAWIDIDALPSNPDYRDNDTGTHRYVEPSVARELGSDIYLTRDSRTRRWLFSARTVAAIPELYPKALKSFQDRLPAWTQTRVLGIELWKYLSLLLLVVVAWTVKAVVVVLLARYIRSLAQRSQLTYLDRIMERAGRPIGGLAMALVFHLAIPHLLLPIRVTQATVVAIKALAAFSAVWLAYRLIDVVSDFLLGKAAKTESKLDDQLVPLVSKSLKVVVSVIGGIFLLQNLGINVGSLIAGLGLGGLAFALAAKDTLANFFGSLMIFVDKPFQIGDWVIIGDTEGIIEEVGFRTSRVRTFYNSLVTVPNAMVTNAVVDNYGARQYRRYVANLGLTYDTPPEKVEAFCQGVRALIARTPGMRKDFYMVEFKEFGPSALVIMIYCFMITATWNQELRTRTNLNLDIMRLARELGVSFAFPTQTLHVSTLAQPGESRPSHFGPQRREELAEVIHGFAPGGTRGHPKGMLIAEDYDCDAAAGRGGNDG